MSKETEYVKLISSDGFEFVIHREAAVCSGTIKNMLCGPGIHIDMRSIHVENIV